jgi:hypothetical protein
MVVLAHDARSDECGQLGSRAAFVVRGTEVEARSPLKHGRYATLMFVGGNI